MSEINNFELVKETPRENDTQESLTKNDKDFKQLNDRFQTDHRDSLNYLQNCADKENFQSEQLPENRDYNSE